MSSKDLTQMKMMDMLLVGLTCYLVWKTCSPETPASSSKSSTGDSSTAATDVIVAPSTSPSLPESPDDEEVGPQGMPTEGFGFACDESCPIGPDGAPIEGCTPCESFGQTVTPAPAPVGGKACPPSMIYTKKHLPTADAEEGCWSGNAPRGAGSMTSKCIEGGVAKVANFYDAAQTQTVLDALDRDPTREMKIRQAPATANYDLRASPPITFNGYPSMSFIKGNTNVGLKGV